MAFAMYYNDLDATEIDRVINNPPAGLSNADRQLVTAIWNGGFSTWRTAPVLLPDDPIAAGDPGVHRVVIDARVQGQPVTVQRARDLFYRIYNLGLQSANPHLYAIAGAIADDMATTAQEPYP